jgi:outer membrane lipoprotein SlyB
MKSEILKIAGVKDEKSFYKKYPSEEAFMKVHGKAFKKAQMGTEITKAQLGADINKNGIPDYLERVSPTGNDYMGANSVGQQFGSAIGNNSFGPKQDPNFIQNRFPKPVVDIDESYDPSTQSGLTYQPYKPSQKDIINENQQIIGASPISAEKKSSNFDSAQPYINAGLDVFNGIQSLGAEKKAALQAKQSRMVSDVALKASLTRPEMPQRKYVRPEDHVTSGDEFYPIHGVGSNVLARDGANITNRTYGTGEIQNTYAPNDIYEDLSYEPLNDSNKLKSFQFGGTMNPTGFNSFMTGGGGTGLSAMAGAASGNNAGSQIGGGLGSAVGMAFGGPLGAALGNFAGKAIGGALDPHAKKMKKEQEALQRNMQKMMIGQGTESIQANNASYLENGGYVSNDWTPQLIAKFGDHSPEDVYDFAHEGMDSLRTGGNVRQNNMFETDQYALGGELKTHWGGYAETMSHNPYLPDGGETVMFRGKSHEERSPNGETGIGITYGDNPVEVERGEPAVKLQDGTSGDSNLTVFGNLKIPNQYIDLLGDKNAKGKKFKNYIADISKQEAKQNKLIEKSTNELNSLEPITMIDKLKLTALQANIDGANMKLKSFADKKINAASLQNAINDTAEEHSLDADSLAKGQVKQAKFGGSFDKAKDGDKIKKFNSPEEAKKEGYKLESDGKYHLRKKGVAQKPSVSKLAMANKDIPRQHKNAAGLYSGITPEQLEAYKKKNAWYPNWEGFNPNRPGDVQKYQEAFNEKAREYNSDAYLKPDDLFGEQVYSANIDMRKGEYISPPSDEVAEVEDVETTPIPYKRSIFLDAVGQVLPYMRPTDQEDLDGIQLYPEMYAMATNQLEPVDAQGYQPQLSTPYDISYQDQLNANQADYRAAQRMIGYNPAALAQLNAQKYAANTNVLGKQFRDNQENKDEVFSGNRRELNDAKLENLQIYDQQYQRQAQALSNTKATGLAAISSVADKYAKNRLENRTLGVMENMYNYRFDPSGRAVNMNAPYQFNIPTVGSNKAGQKQVPVYNSNGELVNYQLETYDPNAVEEDIAEDTTTVVKPITEKKRNGSIVKAFKNY